MDIRYVHTNYSYSYNTLYTVIMIIWHCLLKFIAGLNFVKQYLGIVFVAIAGKAHFSLYFGAKYYHHEQPTKYALYTVYIA